MQKKLGEVGERTMSLLGVEKHLRFLNAVLGNGNNVAIATALAAASQRSK